MSEELGNLITRTREAANLTQRQLAERLSVNQSRISRMEAGDTTSDEGLYLKALHAIGTSKALTIAQAIILPWKYLRQPSFDHPELSDIIKIEQSLSRLSTFRQADSASQDLLGQADLLLRRLHEVGTFLLKLDYQISYIGEIGVGKTTALCKQSELVLDLSDANDLKGMMLDTGGGRTTLCDVVVQKADRYAFFVDPLADEEVYRLAGELCQSVFEAKDPDRRTLTASDYRPSEEITRALRNMSGLLRSRKDRNAPFVDPLAELAFHSRTLDDLQAEFASRLTLWRRTRKEVEFDGADDSAGRRWFRETFTAINNGRHQDFSIPGKITATVPFFPIEDASFNVTLLDTRGIDGSSIRPDIISHLKDDRSLTVLCSKWGSAPDPALQSLLKHVIETEVDRSIFERATIMIVARSGDALSTKNDAGDHAEDTAEGYDIKTRQVQDALDRENLPQLPVFAFDATSDSSARASEFLISKIMTLRKRHVRNAAETMAAVDQMIENAQQSRALAAFRSINDELKLFAGQEEILQQDNGHVHVRLLRALGGTHPRTIWASVRRKGNYWNFDFYQHLADGAAAEVKRQNGVVFERLRTEILAKMDSIEYTAVKKFLRQLLENISSWENDLASAIRHYTMATYKQRLNQDPIWEKSERLYGTGAPYRDRVVTMFEQWFAESKDISTDLNFKFQLAWQKSFIEPLLRTAGEGFDI